MRRAALRDLIRVLNGVNYNGRGTVGLLCLLGGSILCVILRFVRDLLYARRALTSSNVHFVRRRGEDLHQLFRRLSMVFGSTLSILFTLPCPRTLSFQSIGLCGIAAHFPNCLGGHLHLSNA